MSVPKHWLLSMWYLVSNSIYTQIRILHVVNAQFHKDDVHTDIATNPINCTQIALTK
jgi:hypothetical protein